MRKLLNKPWFVGVLAVAAIGLIADAVRPRSSGHRSAGLRASHALSEQSLSSDEIDLAVVTAGLPIREALAALVLPEVLPDPFARRGVTVVADDREAPPREIEETESVLLSAIWRQTGVDLVLVNGRVRAVGDVIGRMTIQSIDRDGMWVTHWKGRDHVALGAAFTLSTPVRADGTSTLALHER